MTNSIELNRYYNTKTAAEEVAIFISMSNVLDQSWNILVLQRRKRTILILQGKSISFPTRRIVILFYPSFAFKCSVIQQRETVVLESMSFEALSCKGGASIIICTSRALTLRVLVWHLLRSTAVVMLPCMLTRGGIRLPIDSHVEHFILAA